MGGFNMQRFHEAGQAFEIDPVCEMKVDPQAVIATIPSGAAPNGISFSVLPAVPAPSSEIQLEIPEGGQMDMPGMTP